MPCYHPIDGWRAADGSGITFNRQAAFVDLPVTVACGRCIGCRLEYSRQWAIRCVHENQMHTRSCFLTLTYAPENLPQPEYPTLRLEDFQKFMKRLRKKYGSGIRFFHCGEYGDQTQRPHYHALIFGWRPGDLKLWRQNVRGDLLYTSGELSSLWPLGHSSVGEVTFESAAYTARYITKKITGDAAIGAYSLGGFNRKPPYVTMSRRPGIGASWIEKYADEVLVTDSIVLRGTEVGVPRFYNEHIQCTDPDRYRRIRARRKQEGRKNAAQNTRERLVARETVKRAQISQLKRNL